MPSSIYNASPASQQICPDPSSETLHETSSASTTHPIISYKPSHPVSLIHHHLILLPPIRRCSRTTPTLKPPPAPAPTKASRTRLCHGITYSGRDVSNESSQPERELDPEREQECSPWIQVCGRKLVKEDDEENWDEEEC